jgi:hypothetical protein
MYRFLYRFRRFGNFRVLHYLIRTLGVESKDARSWRPLAPTIKTVRPSTEPRLRMQVDIKYAIQALYPTIKWSCAGK